MDEDKRVPVVSVNLTIPRLVQLLAVAGLILSAGHLFSGILSIAFVHLAPAGTFERIEELVAPESGSARAWMVKHLRQWMYAGALLAVANVVASLGLLMRKRWARNYYMLWACALIAGSTFALSLLYSRTFAGVALPSNMMGALTTIGTRIVQVVTDAGWTHVAWGMLFPLCVLLLLSSPQAVADTPAGFGGAAPIDPQRAPIKSALACGIVGLVVPAFGVVALLLGSIAWIRVQGDAGSGRRNAALIAMLLGAYGCARDIYYLYTTFVH